MALHNPEHLPIIPESCESACDFDPFRGVIGVVNGGEKMHHLGGVKLHH